MMWKRYLILSLGLALSLVACTKNKEETQTKPLETAQTKTGEPERVEVQHILIAFKGSLPGREIERSKEEAETLASELLAKAYQGEDFNALVKSYTDDRAPGIYKMSNHGITPIGEEFGRAMMVPAFGELGFTLGVGSVGLAPFNKESSPYGYHIIKRLR